MENKYYTPAIEDIRVGYECEWREILPEYWKGTDEDWSSYIFTYVNSDFCKKMIAEDSYRTPYLTKEQIEKEGWTKVEEYSTDCINYKNGNWDLVVWYNCHDGNAFLELDRDDEYTYTYYGDCPSINEFRTITKLLNIPKCQNQETELTGNQNSNP